MEANSWEEMKFLKDTAGIPVEKTLGLEDKSQDFPSPTTFKENLTVYGIGDTPLRFELPSPKDIPLIAVPDTKDLDELRVFPPFLDLDDLLSPVFIPATKDPKPPTDPEPMEHSNDSTPSIHDNKDENLEFLTPELIPRGQTPELIPSGSTPELIPSGSSESSQQSIIDLTQDEL